MPISRPVVGKKKVVTRFSRDRRATKVAASREVSTLSRPAHREIGEVILGSGSVGDYTDKTVFTRVLSPRFFGTRCNMLSAMYERYRIRSLRFELLIDKPATAVAMMMVAVDPDVSDPAPLDTASASADMSQWRYNAVSSGGKTAVLVYDPRNVPLNGYYTSYNESGDQRLSDCGTAYVRALISSYGAGDGRSVFTLKLKFDIDFYEPSVEDITFSGAASGAGTGLPGTGAGQGWNNVAPHLDTVASSVRGITRTVDSAGNESLRVTPGNYKFCVGAGCTGTLTGSFAITGLAVSYLTRAADAVVTVLRNVSVDAVNEMATYIADVVVPEGTVIIVGLTLAYTATGNLLHHLVASRTTL